MHYFDPSLIIIQEIYNSSNLFSFMVILLHAKVFYIIFYLLIYSYLFILSWKWWFNVSHLIYYSNKGVFFTFETNALLFIKRVIHNKEHDPSSRYRSISLQFDLLLFRMIIWQGMCIIISLWGVIQNFSNVSKSKIFPLYFSSNNIFIWWLMI